MEGGYDPEEHLEWVEIQGEGATGDEGRTFGVETVADTVGSLGAGFPGRGGLGQRRLLEDVVADLLHASGGGRLSPDGGEDGDSQCEKGGTNAREAAARTRNWSALLLRI